MKKLITVLFISTAALQAQPTVQSLLNALSNQATFSPGSLAFVYGTNLMVGTTVPTVTVAGLGAYVFPSPGSTASQLTIQLPVSASPGPTTLTVTAGGQTSAAFNLTLAAYAPAFSAVGSTGVGAFYDTKFNSITATNPATPGETIIGYATGLGATNPAIPTGGTASGLAPTVAPVTLTVGGQAEAPAFSGGSGTVGLYQVNFVVPKNACSTNVVLTVGGISSPAVTVPIAFTPPVVCAIENSATGVVKDATHGLAANSFVTLYALGTVATNSAANIFPAMSYQGVEVLFNGMPVPLYAVDNLSASLILINAMVPAESGTTGSAVVTLQTSAGTTASYPVELTAADPGVFRLPNPTTGTGSQGVVLVAGTYRFAMPSSLASAYGLPGCTGLPATSPCGQPAAPGDNIVIYLTGGGLATPNGSASGMPVPTGSVAPADGSVIYETVLTPVITIGGLPAMVAFSGIAPGTGSEYQINTTIPTGVTTSDTVPVMITMGGHTDTVTIAVKVP